MLLTATFIILFAAPAIQVIYSIRRINKTCTLSLALIGFYTFLSGMTSSIPGVFIFMYLLPADTHCANSALGFLPLELIILLITTPIIYGIYKIRLKRKLKKTAL
jgi:hypothetical protein